MTRGTCVKGYCDNIEQRTVENDNFRQVLYTGKHLQLVVMTLPPGCDIGEEVHDDRGCAPNRLSRERACQECGSIAALMQGWIRDEAIIIIPEPAGRMLCCYTPSPYILELGSGWSPRADLTLEATLWRHAQPRFFGRIDPTYLLSAEGAISHLPAFTTATSTSVAAAGQDERLGRRRTGQY